MLAESLLQGYLVVPLIIIIVLLVLLVLLWNRLRQRPKEPTFHMLPGQVNLLANHAPGLSAEQIAAQVRENSIFQDEQTRRAIVSPERIVTFESDQGTFSLVFVDLPAVREEKELVQLISSINERIGSTDRPRQPPPYEQTDGRKQPAARTLGEPPNGANPPGEVTLRVATPNWLSGGEAQHNGVGGPGARPVPAAAIPPPGPSGLQPWQFEMPSKLVFQKPLEERGEGVDVYILDTAPCHIDLERAYKRWGQSHQHELLASLLGPGSPLDITYAGYSHLLQLANFFLPDHDYIMADHGLFVAGIIHAIAPKAKLHLIEVLNPYGVGTYESIARGFAIAAKHRATQPKLLVNASLVLKVAQPDPDWLKIVVQRDPFWKLFTLQQIKQTAEPLATICQRLYGHVIAAAGNDNKPTLPFRPPARFPAAFHSVLGVGALNHDNVTPASYSNISDTPESEGITAFGGEVAGDLTDPQFGVLGAYISVFPDGTLNQTGWARWAGTSFATPVITGMIAALMSEENPNNLGQQYSVQEAIQVLRDVDLTTTPVGEVLPVTQG